RSDLREGHHRGIFSMRGPERVDDHCGIIAERSEDGAREGETFFRIFRLLAGVEADVLEENNRSWLLRAEGITIPFALEINELDIQPEELSETRSDRSKRELLSISLLSFGTPEVPAHEHLRSLLDEGLDGPYGLLQS